MRASGDPRRRDRSEPASENPYAAPATVSAPAPSASTEDSDVAKSLKRLRSRRRAFATVLSLGGWLHAIAGAAALATGIREGASITSPNLGIAIAALGLGVPLALLGGLLALRVRFALFVAFPLSCVCGGIGFAGFAIAVERAGRSWTGSDPPPVTLAVMAPTFAFLAVSFVIGYLLDRTITALMRAGVSSHAIASTEP